MSEARPGTARTLGERFAALVGAAVEQAGDAAALRAAARAVTDAARGTRVTLTVGADALAADGEPFDAPLLHRRLLAHGVEELGVTSRASLADLMDLARLLASDPGEGDPVARFRARAAALDATALPRRLREGTAADFAPPAPSVPTAGGRPTPSSTRRATPAAGTRATPRSVPRATPTPTRRVTPIAHSTVPQETTEGAPPRRDSSPGRRFTPHSTPTVAEPAVPPAPRDAAVRLEHALPVPETENSALRSAILALQGAEEPARLATTLDQMVQLCDLAFRQGRHDDLIEGLAALVGIEFVQLERDPSDERRQTFNLAVRRLARPVLLRQLAMLRHQRAADPVTAERVQQALYRFGLDAAEAVIDECIAAPTAAAREACLASLRGLSRAHEALAALVGDLDEVVVRQAVGILGDLRDEASAAALDRILDHPDATTRRDVVTARARFDDEGAWEALVYAIGDESALVRARAVSLLGARREARALPLLEPLLAGEAEQQVLFAAIDALARLGTPEAVQRLIPIAHGTAAGTGASSRARAAIRIQACLALVTIRTPQAMAAVQVLRDDRDREVRQASVRLVAHARRRPTTVAGMRAVTE